MIQFNLLPDVKLQWLKANRTKHMMSFVAIIVGGVSLLILALSFVTVDVVQKQHMQNLNKSITAKSNELKKTPNINRMLTVQNQLNTLTSLHDQKAVTSRLFDDLAKTTPDKVTISSIELDFTANSATITGEAPDLDTINTYVDTLKATTYTAVTDNGEPLSPTDAKAFSSVVLSSFGRDSRSATYTISLNFDPQIFSGTNTSVTLSVKNSVVVNSGEIFRQQADK